LVTPNNGKDSTVATTDTNSADSSYTTTNIPPIFAYEKKMGSFIEDSSKTTINNLASQIQTFLKMFPLSFLFFRFFNFWSICSLYLLI
jgi:hypothetical protein